MQYLFFGKSGVGKSALATALLIPFLRNDTEAHMDKNGLLEFLHTSPKERMTLCRRRIRQLNAMHELMTEANDEMIYMSWIYVVPDCPSEEDFESIAISDEQYNEAFDLFVKLIAKKGNRY